MDMKLRDYKTCPFYNIKGEKGCHYIHHQLKN